MKKIILLLAVVMVMATSSLCAAAASVGNIIDTEAELAERFLKSDNFKNVNSMMTSEFLQNWDEAAYNNFKTSLLRDFGNINLHTLRVIEKYDDAEVLTYQVVSDKIPAARFIYVFTTGTDKPLLRDFSVLLPKPKEEEGQATPAADGQK